MAEVKTIDIDGVQWEMKDQTARDKIIEQETKINSLQDNLSVVNSKIYVNKSKGIFTGTENQKWIKIENTYPHSPYAPNIFLIGTRRGGIYILSCSKDDNNIDWNPVFIKLYDELNRITSVKAKSGTIYIQSDANNSVDIQQINKMPEQITITEEEPPEDATDIIIIEK